MVKTPSSTSSGIAFLNELEAGEEVHDPSLRVLHAERALGGAPADDPGHDSFKLKASKGHEIVCCMLGRFRPLGEASAICICFQ